MCAFKSQEPSLSHSGPFHHKEEPKRTSTGTRLDGKSAGVFSPLTCLQRSLGTNVCIFATRLRTNVFQVFSGSKIRRLWNQSKRILKSQVASQQKRTELKL